MLRKLILFFFVFLSTSIFSQNLYVCKNYTPDGKPIGTRSEWQIKPWGSDLIILYDNEGKVIQDPLVYLFIDKLDENSFKAYDSKAIRIVESKSWLAINYEFRSEGKYRIYIMDSNQKQLASKTVNMKFETVSPEPRQEVNFSSSFYANTKMLFCEFVLNGKPINILDEADIDDNGGLVYTYINNYRPLNTEKFVVSIWRKTETTGEYDELYDSKKYKTSPEWTYSFFKYKFTEPGEYRMSVYDDSDRLIKSKTISIVK